MNNFLGPKPGYYSWPRILLRFVRDVLIHLFLFPVIMAFVGMGIGVYSTITEGTPLLIGLAAGAVLGFIVGVAMMIFGRVLN